MTELTVTTPRWLWHRLYWTQPIAAERATSVLRAWAADQRSPRIVLEARASNGVVRYLLGLPAAASSDVLAVLRGLVPDVSIVPSGIERTAARLSVRLKASTRHRAIQTADIAEIVRVILAALTRAGDGEELILQVLLGPRRVPLAIPTHSHSAIAASQWEVLRWGNGGQIDSEKRTALRNKVSDHGYACTVRIGVRAASGLRRRQLLLGLVAAVRTSEAAGVRLRVVAERRRKLDEVIRPWFWPLRLNVQELTGLTAWPLDADDLPGQPAPHPKPLPPAAGTTGKRRVIATATAPGVRADLVISAQNALHHVLVLGPTGTGKSTLLAGLILQDIQDGRPVVVVEPKGDLIADVLARVPEHRRDDVVVLDPSDTQPVGLNPLHVRGRRPEVVADSVLAIFKQLYGEAIGPRSADILHAGLLTLAQRPDASLVMLPLLLTNPGFRRRLTAGLRDPIALEPFWAGFERWSDAEQAAAIAPVMNKLRPLLRPSLRAVLGQREPRFTLRQVFTERKILLVPLQRGVIGPDAAALLGSLVVAELWQTSQERAAIPASRRHPVMVYIDEVQDYLHLPTDLGEALAQARGLGVGFHLAHQFLGQLPLPTRIAVLSNARSRIVFQTSPADATELAKGHPELSAEDLTALGAYEVYASAYGNGRVNPYASGRTASLGKPTGDADVLRQASRERYGVGLSVIEAGFAALLSEPQYTGTTGRRRRTP